MVRVLAALLAGLVLALPAKSAPADEMPPAGTWKVIAPLMRGAGSQAIWLLQFQKKDDKWTGSILASAEGAPKATVEGLRVTKEKLSFTLKTTGPSLACVINLPSGKAETLYGTASVGDNIMPLELGRTTLTALDSFSLAKERLGKAKPGYEVVMAVMQLLQQAEKQKVKPDEVRSWAARAVKAAGLYGDRWKREVTLLIAQILGQGKGYDAIVLQYARQAERLLENKDDARTKKKVLQVLATALEKAGKTEDAKEVKARIAKLDFSIKLTPFAGRKGKSDRALLLELFTSTECDPCLAAEMSFNAFSKTYKPSEVVLLEYHLPRPGPDPLACPAAEARAKFYGDQVGRLPAMFFNTNSLRVPAGDASDAQEIYNAFLTLIGRNLERPADVKLKAVATRKGDKIDVKIDVSGLKDKSEEVRLRILLVEEQIDYKGSNNLAVHHHVVRAIVGDADGVALKGKDLSKTFSADLAKVRKDIKDYLDKEAKKKPFAGKVPPLDPKKLRVVAFVQNDGTNQVLQAVLAPIKE